MTEAESTFRNFVILQYLDGRSPEEQFDTEHL
jgi:hypothetical protein